MDAWIALARAYGAAISAIEGALRAGGFPPLEWYDILLELENASDAGLRQFELKQKLLLRQYNVSRLVERIEKQGLLRRAPCPTDGRAHILFITEQGMELRRRMWSVYGPIIEQAIGQCLTAEQANQLRQLLELIANNQTTASPN